MDGLFEKSCSQQPGHDHTARVENKSPGKGDSNHRCNIGQQKAPPDDAPPFERPVDHHGGRQTQYQGQEGSAKGIEKRCIKRRPKVMLGEYFYKIFQRCGILPPGKAAQIEQPHPVKGEPEIPDNRKENN